MNNRYVARLNMAHTCLEVIQAPEHAVVHTAASATWQKVVQNAGQLVQDIMDAGLALDAAMRPSSAVKKEALTRAGDRAWTVVGSLHALARENSLTKLVEATATSRSGIRQGSVTTVINRCRAIHQLAMENLALLQQDNVSEAEVSALQLAIEHLESVHTRPRETRTAAKAARQRLDLLVEELMGLFTERLDKLAVKFRETAPDFYRAYRASRVIVDPPTRAKEKESDPKAPEVGTK